MDMTLVSIIIPVYNLEHYISDTLASIYGQGVDDSVFEVVVVDDGSTDSSADIVRGFSSRHANLRLIQKPNGGVSSARNCGMKNISGRHVIFLDGDDFLAEGALADVVSMLETFKCEPDIIMMKEVLSDTHAEKYSWKDISVDYAYEHRGASFSRKYTGNELFSAGYFRSTVTGLVFGREFLVNTGCTFDEGAHFMGEDFIFINTVLPSARSVILWDRILYMIIVRQGSISRNMSAERYKLAAHNLRSMLDSSRSVAASVPGSAPAMEYSRFKMLMHYMKTGIRGGVPHCLMEIRAMLPSGYLPVRTSGVPRERWKMRLMDISLPAFYMLLVLQNILKK